jgi:Ras-related C3 botulinum toxin substrate 1
VAVGDPAVGKTCLLWTYASDEFPAEYVPTTPGAKVKTYEKEEIVNGMRVTMQLWDITGQEDTEGVRQRYYHSTDVFLIVFDVSNRESFQHVETRVRMWQLDTACLVVIATGPRG